MNIYRFEIESLYQNNQNWIDSAKKYSGLEIEKISFAQVFWIQTDLALDAVNTLMKHSFDPISQILKVSDSESVFQVQVDVFYKSGVTDSVARSLETLLSFYTNETLKVTSGQVLNLMGTDLTVQKLSPWIYLGFANSLLHDVSFRRNSEFPERFNLFSKELFKKSDLEIHDSKEINIFSEQIYEWNKVNCWAFSEVEIAEIRNFYKNLNKLPTDVEIEVIAQTWSEHCKHKIFMAEIDYSESTNEHRKIGNHKVQSLFKDYIKKATEDLKETCPWLVSVFSDNAGVVGWDPLMNLCIKVETHNSPSALDPYGGSITGILGVNRDILGCGLGAKPIANTNVLCFGDLKTQQEELPLGLKTPLQILKGVHLGIEHGGNKSGIPTVNGSMHFDKSYTGKPLVYCGTVGTLPKKLKDGRTGIQKKAMPGDFIYLVGGGTGKDGIHGATFSSLELHDQIPSHVVQIGDPYTQKCVADFILKARDLGMYSSITDNGAGGISSSVGEMAQESGGAVVFLDAVPLKYPGLNAWEITVSESQERMTVAVPEKNKKAFEKLANELFVQSHCIGHFTNSGILQIEHNSKNVASIDLKWLHRGTPQLKLKAVFDQNFQKQQMENRKLTNKLSEVISLKDCLFELLASANVASKENLIRRFDHEVQGATVVKPFSGSTQSAPSDSAVLSLEIHGGAPGSGIAISHGMAAKMSVYDSFVMAQMAVDEAIRNLLSSGVNLDKICLLDNFCWPDPTGNTEEGHYKCAQLVRANAGLYEATQIFKAPLVSGKDSMKNDFKGFMADGTAKNISVLPTLLVTAMGYIEDLNRVKPSYFHDLNESVYLVGEKSEGLLLSEFAEKFKTEKFTETVPSIDLRKNYSTYQQLQNSWDLIQSLHDVSEGGALISAVESCFGENKGLHLNLDQLSKVELYDLCFSEGSGRFIVSLRSKDKEKFLTQMQGVHLIEIGKVTSSHEFILNTFNETLKIPVAELLETWKEGLSV